MLRRSWTATILVIALTALMLSQAANAQATGTVAGTVFGYSCQGTVPLAGATVTATGPATATATTQTDGSYSLQLASGTYTLTASAANYNSATLTMAVSSGSAATGANFYLGPSGPCQTTTTSATQTGYIQGPSFQTATGHTLSFQYVSSISSADVQTGNRMLSTYVPQLFSLFYSPTTDQLVTIQMVKGAGDFAGNQAMNLDPSSWNSPASWVHELTHVVQWTGPVSGIGGDATLFYLESTAMAAERILANEGYVDLSFWSPWQGVSYAAAVYGLKPNIYDPHMWMGFYQADHEIFQKVNARLFQFGQQQQYVADVPSFRELIRESTAVQSLDGLPVDQWLAAEGMLGRSERNAAGTTVGLTDARYFAQGSMAGSANLAFQILAPSDTLYGGNLAVDVSQSRASVYDAVTRQKLADMIAYGDQNSPFFGYFQMQGLQNPPAAIRVDMHVASATGFVSDLSLIIPDFSANPSTVSPGTSVFLPAPDFWLQTVGGTANIGGQTYQVSNGLLTVQLGGPANMTWTAGQTLVVQNVLPNQIIALGISYDAVRLMQNSTTINIASLTTSSSATSSTVTTSQATQTTSQTSTVPPDFTVSASPTSLIAPQSSRSTVSVKVQSVGGFSGPVNLSVSGLPAGMDASLDRSQLTLSPDGQATAVLTLTVPNGLQTGSYTLTVTATSGSTAKTATVLVNVSGCLIATATYGSELAPEVQFLRDFRDRQIMRTFAGSSFMVAFNAWYYSFSPRVAAYEYGHPFVRSAIKVGLYPLLAVLRASSETYALLGSWPEAAALAAGLVASFGIGILYLGLPAAALTIAVNRRPNRRAARALGVLLGASVFGFVVAVLTGTATLMVAASVAIALSALVAGAFTPVMLTVKVHPSDADWPSPRRT